ncbi:hypothetical protein [Sphingomonas sp.]|uniref:hypothetical protein n=1 Tax=Sphingomonas sp. TaxID=28214 RepID=UPI00286C6FB9|nr:hypothetical protein [Sphingomonas sp.]
MRTAQTLVIPLVIVLALAGCDKRDPVADEANNTAGLPSVNMVAGAKNGASSVDGSAPANVVVVPAGAPPVPAAAIPAALHGRWGMTPADCTSTKGDAKGLLVVSGGRLAFYESRAVPARNVSVSKDSIGADFVFTGEGQSWSKFETLQLKKAKLVRTESSPMASFTYARCT